MYTGNFGLLELPSFKPHIILILAIFLVSFFFIFPFVSFWDLAYSLLVFLMLSLFMFGIFVRSFSEFNLFVTSAVVSISFANILYAVYFYRYGVPFYNGGSDDFQFVNYARDIGNEFVPYDRELILESLGLYFHNSLGYVYFIYLFDYLSYLISAVNDSITLRYINSAFLGLISVFVYRIIRCFSGEGSLCNARNLSLISSCSPIMLFVAGHVFRDIIVCFLVLLATYISSKYKSGFFNFSILSMKMMVICLILTQFRFEYVLICAILFIIVFLKYIKSIVSPRKYKAFVVFFLIVIILVVYLAYVIMFSGSVKYYDNYLAEQSSGFSSVIFSSPQPVQSILRLFYSLVYPLPFYMYDKPEDFFVSTGTVIQIYFLLYIFISICFGLKVRISDFIFPFILVFFVLYFGFVFGTFTFRHIASFWPFMTIVFAFFNMQNKNLVHEFSAVLTVFSFVFLFLCYFLISV